MSRQRKQEDHCPFKRSVDSSVSPNCKRKRLLETDENMSDNSIDPNRRPNFSNVGYVQVGNGFSRNLNMVQLKPTAAKKIVIKNLKSE